MNTKQIGIAVVEHARRYLVGVRGPDVALAGFAEFPGGKCLIGESPFACAVRECLEETGLIVIPERLLQHKEFEYPHGPVSLHFVLCHPVNQSDIQDQYQQFRWHSAQGLRVLKFPEANADVIDLLSQVSDQS
jgi:8-oxo-dGTP diphosphatase